jgi:hypothetical protein
MHMTILERTGMAIGWGLLTFALGGIVIAAATLGQRWPRLHDLVRPAGVVTLQMATGFGLSQWIVTEEPSHGPGIGFVATALGGLIATIRGGGRGSRIREPRMTSDLDR